MKRGARQRELKVQGDSTYQFILKLMKELDH